MGRSIFELSPDFEVLPRFWKVSGLHKIQFSCFVSIYERGFASLLPSYDCINLARRKLAPLETILSVRLDLSNEQLAV